MSEFKKRVYYGCQTHAGEYDFYCHSCFMSAMSRLVEEVERIDKQLNESPELDEEGWPRRHTRETTLHPVSDIEFEIELRDLSQTQLYKYREELVVTYPQHRVSMQHNEMTGVTIFKVYKEKNE